MKREVVFRKKFKQEYNKLIQKNLALKDSLDLGIESIFNDEFQIDDNLNQYFPNHLVVDVDQDLVIILQKTKKIYTLLDIKSRSNLKNMLILDICNTFVDPDEIE